MASLGSPSSATNGPISGQTVTPYTTLASLYDALLGNQFFPQLKRNFEWLVRRYRIRFASAADVACGTGIFIRYLRQRGVRKIFGVDRSSHMLRVATSRNRDNGVRLFQQDFSALQLPQPVDLITSNFDSLNYLLTPRQLFQALQQFHRNLRPGGHLIFDMITPRQPWRGSQPRIERMRLNGIMFWRRMHIDPRTGLQESLVRITRNGQTEQEIHYQRAYPLGLTVDSVQRAGFRILGIHPFVHLGPVTAHTRRVIFIARKV
jgi:SAM-dependent methyltransferase